MVCGTTPSGQPFSNAAEGFQEVYGYSADGAGDRAYLYDSADALDVFFAQPGYAYLRGGGPFARVTNFDQVVGMATAAGPYRDVARLTGSAGHDLLEASPEEATLKFNGNDSTFVQASGFYCVHGYGSTDPTDGLDRANLFDSPQSADILRAWPGIARFGGSGFYQKLLGFEQVSATATAGDQDAARLWDSAGDDVLEASPEEVTLKYDGDEQTFVKVSHFHQVQGYASDGLDAAHLTDSAPTKEIFRADPGVSRLYNDDFCHRLVGFEQVSATATAGGFDDATLTGSAGDDVFIFDGDLQEATLKFHGNEQTFVQASGFFVMRASGSSGTDQALLGDSPGGDIFTAEDTDAVLRSGTFYLKASSFEAEVPLGDQPVGGPVAVAFERNDNDRAYLLEPTIWKAIGDWENLQEPSPLHFYIPLPDGSWMDALLSASEAQDESETEALDYLLETVGPWIDT
jgi:hypothetical protein